MRDLVFLAFLAAMFAGGLKRPFLLVLTYVYIDNVSPQQLSYYLLNSVPVSMIAAAACVGGYLFLDAKQDSRFAPRQAALLILLLYCGLTTMAADFPVEAKEKWDWVWKALAFAIFLPLTLRTKLRIEALLLFLVLSASSIIIVGGIKTALSGGGYGSLDLMVNSNTGLYEGSTISTVAIAIIPLILWFTRHGTIFAPDWKVKVFGYALVLACLLIPVGTSTRTGLVCIALLALLMLREVKRPMLYLGAMALMGVAAVPFLPSAFTDRMSTIKTYKADESASTRLAVWQWTMAYAKQHPFGGGFEAYRQNKISYDLDGKAGAGTTREVDAARAYHSAYFEMLGEQGYPGLLLWLGINVAGLWRMEALRRRYRRSAEAGEAWIAPLASALQMGHLTYLVGAAFIAIAFQPFIFMLIGAQIGLDTYLARIAKGGAFRSTRRPRPAPATA